MDASAAAPDLSRNDGHRRGDHKREVETPGLSGLKARRSLWKVLFVRAGWLVVVAALVPMDGAIREPVQRVHESLGGDIRRELRAYSQFGGLTSVVLIGLVIVLLDRAKSARLWDLVLSMASASLVTTALKILIGRTRPRFETPEHFLGFWDSMPTSMDAEPIYSWQLWAKAPAEFWSMPSGHSSAAFALATFLALTYPRIRWVVFGVAAVVPISRLTADAHWAADVVLGSCIGAWVASAVTRRGLGRRLAGRVGLLRAGPGAGG